MMKVTEKTIQAVIMRYVIDDLNHEYAVPNTTQVFYWEADLISSTRAGLIHEFEIKLNNQDYKADARKINKHWLIDNRMKCPNYFWYVTYAFDITPPEKAGWIKVTKTESLRNYGWVIQVMKPAPRLHTQKLTERQTKQVLRSLAYRVLTGYLEKYIKE